jgi:putative hemolysin
VSPELWLFVVCAALSGLFSGSETALMSASRIRLHRMAAEGDGAARRVLQLVQDPRKLLAGILVGNTVVNTLAASSATAFCVRRFGAASGVALAATGSTVLLVLFSEYLPKSFAAMHPIGVARAVVTPVRVALFCLTPVVIPLEALTRPLKRLLRGRVEGLGLAEMRMALLEGVSGGKVDETMARVLRGGLSLEWKTAGDCLIPRVDVVGVDVNASYETCLEALRREKYSRLLVMEGSPDRDVGYLAAKDLPFVPEEERKNWTASRDVRQTLRVPMSLPLTQLLARMRRSGVHFAVVKDEHGGTEGIVTLEDVLEEVVGEIRDEHDADERPPVAQIADGAWSVRGDVSVRELEDRLQMEISTEDSTTVGGLMGEALGKVVRQGDVVELDAVRLTAERVSGRRVLFVRLDRKAPG